MTDQAEAFAVACGGTDTKETGISGESFSIL